MVSLRVADDNKLQVMHVQRNPRANTMASLMAERLRSTCTQETGVQFLGQEDPLEEEGATDSSVLA